MRELHQLNHCSSPLPPDRITVAKKIATVISAPSSPDPAKIEAHGQPIDRRPAAVHLRPSPPPLAAVHRRRSSRRQPLKNPGRCSAIVLPPGLRLIAVQPPPRLTLSSDHHLRRSPPSTAAVRRLRQRQQPVASTACHPAPPRLHSPVTLRKPARAFKFRQLVPCRAKESQPDRSVACQRSCHRATTSVASSEETAGLFILPSALRKNSRASSCRACRAMRAKELQQLLKFSWFLPWILHQQCLPTFGSSLDSSIEAPTNF